MDGREFSLFATDPTTPVRHLSETVSSGDQAHGHLLGRQRIELLDVSLDRVQVRQSFVGPDYLRHE